MAARPRAASYILRLLASAFPFIVFLLPRSCHCSTLRSLVQPGFSAAQIYWIDSKGLFLVSNNSAFAFGFRPFDEVTSFILAIVHQPSSRIVWTANLGTPVSSTDKFVFGLDGNANLEYGGRTIWSTNSAARGADAMVLLDSGNLVIRAKDRVVWQSFDHPTDTLLSKQIFSAGMRLTSKPNDHGLVHYLDFEGGDMVLWADFSPPQPYWRMSREPRLTHNNAKQEFTSAVLVGTSWNISDRNNSLIGQFLWSGTADIDTNSTGALILDEKGFISLINLEGNGAGGRLIPLDPCAVPERCGPYSICDSETVCRCPAVLNINQNCDPNITSFCGDGSPGPFVLEKVDNGVGYFATDFVAPTVNGSNIKSCTVACHGNCSCVALIFDNSSGNCFLFDRIGSLRRLQGGPNGGGSSMYIKISRDGAGKGKNRGSLGRVIAIVLIVLGTVAVIAGLLWTAVRIQRRKKSSEAPLDGGGSDEEDNYLESISGMPVRFTYSDLRQATDDFLVKLGSGGFGTVYLGKLRDGSRVAVKKLEGVHQGTKEFRAEVSIIGSIHHIHLVRLRGFCAEGSHRLLAYEYMSNGSLDRWIFRRDKEGHQLDWEKRFNIALGTAKGLAYLHEDCESKIVHCDIKPENVLLDDNFEAKVSDFGLAKMMTREQSHVFTTLRGTRGYLAPEWITNYAISEKSDVYSFGMVLLEIIGGRKNFDPSETSEKAHFPSYAFKMMEEGKLREVLDSTLLLSDKDDSVETTIKVALWCIQEDMTLRPSMAKVVQMLEGLTDVPQPPTSSQMGFRLYANLIKTMSEEGSSAASGPSDWNSEALLSAVRLSGPR